MRKLTKKHSRFFKYELNYPMHHWRIHTFSVLIDGVVNFTNGVRSGKEYSHYYETSGKWVGFNIPKRMLPVYTYFPPIKKKLWRRK